MIGIGSGAKKADRDIPNSGYEFDIDQHYSTSGPGTPSDLEGEGPQNKWGIVHFPYLIHFRSEIKSHTS